jgi:hypothetical protein
LRCSASARGPRDGDQRVARRHPDDRLEPPASGNPGPRRARRGGRRDRSRVAALFDALGQRTCASRSRRPTATVSPRSRAWPASGSRAWIRGSATRTSPSSRACSSGKGRRGDRPLPRRRCAGSRRGLCLGSDARIVAARPGAHRVDTSALHLLGADDLRVPRVQRLHPRPLAAACGRPPALPDDPRLPHPVPSGSWIGVDPGCPASGWSGRMSPQPAPIRAPGRLPSWNTGQRYPAPGRPRARLSDVDDRACASRDLRVRRAGSGGGATPVCWLLTPLASSLGPC